MAYFWATWLKDALMSDPFVAARVIEVPGWQTRGRPPADFSFLPTGIVDHHTACLIRHGHDPQTCLNGILAGKVDVPGPISQLFGTWTPPGVKWDGTNADPRIFIVAAGRANHAGTGVYPWGAPGGNGSSIGIEWCGPPETGSWPDVVIELRQRVDAAILRHNGWPVSHVTTHWEYATPSGRKIDPSAPWRAEPQLAWNAHWSPGLWRLGIADKLVNSQPPVAPEEENMHPINPGQRAYDSRLNGGRFAPGETRSIDLGIPVCKAAAVNITAVNPSANGFVSMWGAGPQPSTSVLNTTAGQTLANGVITAVNGSSVLVYSHVATDIILDVTAYWT